MSIESGLKIFFVFVLIFILLGCKNDEIIDEEIDIVGECQIFVNDCITLSIIGELSDLYEWQSSNPDIATVSNGEVVGISIGEVSINVIRKNKILASHQIKVIDKSILTIIGKEAILIGETIDLEVLSTNIGDQFTFTSSDEEIATVIDGKVTGLALGQVIIEVNSLYEGYSSIEIQVVNTLIPTKIDFINVLDEYIVGKSSYQLEALAYPYYSYQDFIWEVGGDKATINKDTGEITFHEEGKIKVIVRSTHKSTVFKVVDLNVKYDENVEVINILYLGNSLTYVNNIPMIIQRMARINDIEIRYECFTPGGATLESILNTYRYSITSQLASKHYHYMILQENSKTNFTNFPSFLDYASQLKAIADAYGTETILYQTWAYKDNSVMLNNLNLSRREMQDLITNAYDDVADEIKCRINPVGEIFYAFSLAYPEINLYADDNHASLAGSYLASCVHYVSLFNEPVIGNQYEVKLDDNLKLLIQTFVSNYLIK